MKILLFADSSANIGAGHVMRSLVLARELMDLGHDVAVAGKGAAELAASVRSLSTVLALECNDPFHTPERIRLTQKVRPDLIVVDGYYFQPELFEELDREGFPYGIIDDNCRSAAIKPRFIIDQNANASETEYRERFPGALVMVGLEYCLIRRELVEARDRRPSIATEPHAMVSLGGSDILSLAEPVCGLLQALDVSVKISVGTQVRNRGLAIERLSRLSRVSVIHQSEFEETLRTSRLAVTSAGTTLWEALYLGKPTVALIVAENQIVPGKTARNQFAGLEVINCLEDNLWAESFQEASKALIENFSGTGPQTNQVTIASRKASETISTHFSVEG